MKILLSLSTEKKELEKVIILWKSMGPINFGLVSGILQIIFFCVLQKIEMHLGLELT